MPQKIGLRHGSLLVVALGSALTLWTVWYLTHLPWLGMSEKLIIPLLVLTWLAALYLFGRTEFSRGSLANFAGAGLASAAFGVLILGTKLQGAPNMALAVVGFFLLGTTLGLIAGAIDRLTPQRAHTHAPPAIARYALICALTAAPLIFAGGLVTSANAGMAVPDWPNTFGSNMFLYPLGPRAQVPEGGDAKKIYLEHFHRLFGTLLGLSTLILLVWALRSRISRGLKILAGVAFGLVCVQGVLGGVRVLAGSAEHAKDNRILAILHGVLGQVLFGVLIALAVLLHPSAQHVAPPANDEERAVRRKFNRMATSALHGTLFMLLLGAAYRHTRHIHIAWTHAAIAIFVMIGALMAGFVARSLPRQIGAGGVARAIGPWVVGVVTVQFVMGWLAFLLGGRTLEAATPAQALLRTAHQANGALLIALLTALWLCGKRLNRPLPTGQ